jgi:hypothetical protein
VIVLVQPHSESISTWRDINPRHAALATSLLGVFTVMSLSPWLRAGFELQPLSSMDFMLLACVAGMWAVGLHWIWRHRLLERLLGITHPVDRVIGHAAARESE